MCALVKPPISGGGEGIPSSESDSYIIPRFSKLGLWGRRRFLISEARSTTLNFRKGTLMDRSTDQNGYLNDYSNANSNDHSSFNSLSLHFSRHGYPHAKLSPQGFLVVGSSTKLPSS